jgi:hypothetical protein
VASDGRLRWGSRHGGRVVGASAARIVVVGQLEAARQKQTPRSPTAAATLGGKRSTAILLLVGRTVVAHPRARCPDFCYVDHLATFEKVSCIVSRGIAGLNCFADRIGRAAEGLWRSQKMEASHKKERSCRSTLLSTQSRM